MTRGLYIGYDAEMKSLTHRLRPLWVALLLATFVWIPQGCGAASMHKAMSERPPIEWPNDIQRVQVVRAASQITYSIDEETLPNDTAWLRDMRDQIARGLESTSSTQGAPLPIRFRIGVEGQSENVLISECLFGLGWVYWGCPDRRVWATADVILDVNGKLYQGAGRAESTVHALWYNQPEVTSSEMAAYLAIVEAMRAALGSTPHAHLVTNLERQVAMMTSKRAAERSAP